MDQLELIGLALAQTQGKRRSIGQKRFTKFGLVHPHTNFKTTSEAPRRTVFGMQHYFNHNFAVHSLQCVRKICEKKAFFHQFFTNIANFLDNFVIIAIFTL